MKLLLGYLKEGFMTCLGHLLDHYKQVLKVKGISCSNYRSEKLKSRLRSHFLDQIVIEKQNDPSKSELIIPVICLKVKNDHRSKFSTLSNWKEEALKNSGLQRDSNP